MAKRQLIQTLALIGALVILNFSFLNPSSASSTSTFTVSEPHLAPGWFSPLPNSYSPKVWVNVTSSSPNVTVTLYYINLSESYNRNPPTNLSLYVSLPMKLLYPQNLTYEAQMPTFGNYTFVFGEAKAVNTNGTTIYSQPGQIYWVWNPPPQISLSLRLAIFDIDPQFLNMNMSVSVDLYNTKSYSGFSWITNPIFLPTPTKQTYSSYDWVNTQKSVSFFSSQGDPKLFPLDQYTYTINILFPQGFNLTSMGINGKDIQPGIVYNNLSIPTAPNSFKQLSDLSDWVSSSQISYMLPASGKSYPELNITVFSSRNQDTPNILLTTAIAMYWLLGSSILLRGRDEISNRLLIYLSLFVFSFGFFFGIRALPVTPFAIGLTLIERLVFALIPSTVIFAFSSMTRTWFKTYRRFADVGSVIGGFLVTFLLTPFFTMQLWTVAMVFGLLSGSVVLSLRHWWIERGRFWSMERNRLVQRPKERTQRREYSRTLLGFFIGVSVRFSLISRSPYLEIFALQLIYVAALVTIHSLFIAAVVVKLIPTRHTGFWDRFLNFAGIVGLLAGFDLTNILLWKFLGIPMFSY